ncbi:uncharacterized protein TNCV_1161421 [Trichonephila clavipes]|nr:uncharacterized protein TNCV_1161421 [Trichonephila clavipes]
MNLPTPSQRFNKKESGLDTAVETVATVSMQIAAKEAKDVSGHSDITVAIDGNSGNMEVSGAIEIFQRTESLHGLRYTKFLGDGDARAYKAVNEIQPYGDTGIVKLECVGYVKKRMGTRLRALKLKMKRNITKCHVLATLCIIPGFYITRATETADRERLRKANYDILQNSNEARVKKRRKKCILEDTLAEERKNPSYEAAMH